jgi:hypothetical protein
MDYSLMTMKEVIEFVRQFMETEYDILVARYTERDDAVFQKKLLRIEPFLGPEVDFNLERHSPDEKWFAIGEDMLAQGMIAPRTLFQAKQYKHSVWNPLCRVYVSNTVRPRGKRLDYFANLFVAKLDGKHRIISRYELNILDQEGVSFTDNGLSWIWHSGEKIETLGNPTAVEKVVSPDLSPAREEFEAE